MTPGRQAPGLAQASSASGLRLRRLQTPLLFLLELIALAHLAFAATGPRLEVGAGAPPLVVAAAERWSYAAGFGVLAACGLVCATCAWAFGRVARRVALAGPAAARAAG